MAEKAEFAYAICEQALKPVPLTSRHIAVIDKSVSHMYEEYFKKPKAGILTLNNVKLEVGKMIYAKKDGKWICTSIVSIQLNDKDVDQVDNGEVGIVTDIELEKGYEIFVKIE